MNVTSLPNIKKVEKQETTLALVVQYISMRYYLASLRIGNPTRGKKKKKKKRVIEAVAIECKGKNRV